MKATTTTQHFKLDKLSCASCVMHLEAMEDNLDGVQKVDVNFWRLTMEVEYSATQLTPEGIVAAVAAMGYVATPETTVSYKQEKGSLWNKLFRS